jgi:putative tryptophan/tyrosine transport system substrate-binding protein
MLLVLSSPFFAPARSRIAELAIRQRLPTMLYVEAGGLMSYGVNAQANYRQLGFYAAKILNGAKPADLPDQCCSNSESSCQGGAVHT